MNFDRTNETAETFNPDQQVVRSTQTVHREEQQHRGGKSLSPVQNNLPNADAGQSQAGTAQQKQDETTNYEIGKTVRTLVHEQPQIARISLAVMVDGIVQAGPDGKPVWTERSEAELGRIRQLVQGAIGYDEKRGDKVDVVSMRFAAPADGIAPSAASGLFGLGLEKPELLGLGQSAILAVVVLLALLFVLRPMAIRLSAISSQGMLGGSDLLLAGPGSGTLCRAAPGRPKAHHSRQHAAADR